MRMLAAAALALSVGATQAASAEIATARYDVDLDVYPHRIMGDIREKAVLVATDTNGRSYTVDLRDQGPGHNVFEDIAPRVVDADGDGANDIVVVESAQDAGAQLAIYGLRRGTLVKTHATPHIGTPFRWLAPVAVADLDGDGTTEIAYVDRPHLARTLRVWSLAPGGLTEVAQTGGLTNHRIGDEVVWGGLRNCGGGPEMVLADTGWRELQVVTYGGGQLSVRALNLPATADGFARAAECRD